MDAMSSANPLFAHHFAMEAIDEAPRADDALDVAAPIGNVPATPPFKTASVESFQSEPTVIPRPRPSSFLRLPAQLRKLSDLFRARDR